MLNIIRMELLRMFKTRSFYISLPISALLIFVLTYIISTEPVLSSLEKVHFFDVSMISFTVITTLTAIIFISGFVHSFYKTGYYKNVLGKAAHKYHYQAAKTVCITVYTSIIFIVNWVVSFLATLIFFDNVIFGGVKDVLAETLALFLLTLTIGLGAAFFTELFKSNLPAVVYVVLCATTFLQTIITGIDRLINSVFGTDITISDFICSLYIFSADYSFPAPSKVIFHSILLSLIYFVVYNVVGAFCITKLDACNA